ncbi:hypothetical protein H0I76_13515 [Limibaculum sp. M0105]|uniref:Yip1 domain-containing protein n=1 Tax=Thermohalobaculum xanthum TaxID=2753746 RepID=A0A8J7M7W8_9RHOB|nr:hypothetical protein [Thermohalobaculum xanthum]MBK0400211.1 hypothetical protein [Thermohalobaculum xanthum]
MTDIAASSRQPLALRVLTFWADIRGSMRALMAEAPSEGRLLFLAMLSGFVAFLANVTGLWLDPATAAIGPDELTARVAALFVGAILFRTLALYGVAGIAGLAMRAAGGCGDWQASRAAVFWSALAAAPIGFAATFAIGMSPQEGGWTPIFIQSLASVAHAVALSICLAEVHGFRRAWPVFVCVSLAAIGVVAVVGLAGRV